MAQTTAPGAGGLLASVKGIAASLVAIVQTRLELLAVDVAEAREQLIALLVLLLVGLFSLGLGVVLLVLLAVVAMGEANRLLALGAAGGLFLLAAAVCAALAFSRLRASPRLFASSLAELGRDREQLERRP